MVKRIDVSVPMCRVITVKFYYEPKGEKRL